MKPGHSLYRILRITCIVCLGFGLPAAVLPQAAKTTARPPEAQEALDRGVIAAQAQDYVLATRYFQDARRTAPDDPMIFLDLGLAEAKIPGRELRAIAWFGAYLAAKPDASNAPVVKEQIDRLDVANHGNLSRLVKTVQQVSSQFSEPVRSIVLVNAAYNWANLGDFDAALKTSGLIQNASLKADAQDGIIKLQAMTGDVEGARKSAGLIQVNELGIVGVQVRTGDFAGARETADLMKDPEPKSAALAYIAGMQANAGDIAGARSTLAAAQETANLIPDAVGKSNARAYIAGAQAATGDIAGARSTMADVLKTVGMVQNAAEMGSLQVTDAFAQAFAGDVVGAQKSAELIQDAAHKSSALAAIARVQAAARSTEQPTIQAGVADWLSHLDDSNKSSDCALKTNLFLDLAGYQQSLPPSSNPNIMVQSLIDEAKMLIKAQKVIGEMLKQEAAK